jgi:hypothetical protein
LGEPLPQTTFGDCVCISGISAGTYAALISWFQGYQYPLGKRGRSHHINPYPAFIGVVQFLSQLRSFPSELWRTRWNRYYSLSPGKKEVFQSFRGLSFGFIHMPKLVLEQGLRRTARALW